MSAEKLESFLTLSLSKEKGICDICGSTLVQRNDDEILPYIPNDHPNLNQY